jgi:hypothetical protein
MQNIDSKQLLELTINNETLFLEVDDPVELKRLPINDIRLLPPLIACRIKAPIQAFAILEPEIGLIINPLLFDKVLEK